MEKKIVRLGVAGLIRGKAVVEGILGDRNFVLRAVADVNAERLKRCCADFEAMGVEDLHAYSSLEALLADGEVDAVYIATDKPYHARHAIMALEAGKHVLCEIPSVGSVEEAKALRAAVASHPHLKYMAAENAFYFPFMDEWRRMIAEGELGDLVYAEAEYMHATLPQDATRDLSHWRVKQDAIEYLTHTLGPLLSLMDDRCVSVTAMSPRENKQKPWHTGKTVGAALFRTEKGAVIRVLICFGACVGFAHNYALLGTHGSIRTDQSKSFDTAHSFARLASVPESMERPLEIPVGLTVDGTSGHGGCDRRMIREFLRCVSEDLPSPIDADMGIRISLPGVIAKAADKAEREIPIPDERTL